MSASFNVDVTPADTEAFARLSGDWNPLHTDAAYAAATPFRRPVLHGAFSAGLVSRMAGMHLPGRDCLLHGMRLRFIAPIVPPARLVVSGEEKSGSNTLGRVDVTIVDKDTAQRYVEASYDFSRREATIAEAPATRETGAGSSIPVLVTGASGGLGSALLRRLGGRGLGVSRTPVAGAFCAKTAEEIPLIFGERTVGDIVHCAWPTPDNQELLALSDPEAAVERHIAAPLRAVLALARLLAERGAPGASLVLVGSTFADPGRHNYRLPLYSLGKSLVPTLARILAVELAASGHRVVAVVFDVIAGGMNSTLSPAIQQAHADRTPYGRLPNPDEAAEQVAWVLENRSRLVSGATLVLSGGALP